MYEIHDNLFALPKTDKNAGAKGGIQIRLVSEIIGRRNTMSVNLWSWKLHKSV